MFNNVYMFIYFIRGLGEFIMTRFDPSPVLNRPMTRTQSPCARARPLTRLQGKLRAEGSAKIPVTSCNGQNLGMAQDQPEMGFANVKSLLSEVRNREC